MSRNGWAIVLQVFRLILILEAQHSILLRQAIPALWCTSSRISQVVFPLTARLQPRLVQEGLPEENITSEIQHCLEFLQGLFREPNFIFWIKQ